MALLTQGKRTAMVSVTVVLAGWAGEVVAAAVTKIACGGAVFPLAFA